MLAAEFEAASREYPIGFVDEGEAVYPAAVVGVRRGLNLFVGADGAWRGAYIPAYLRCYPFLLAQTPPDTFPLCLDDASRV